MANAAVPAARHQPSPRIAISEQCLKDLSFECPHHWELGALNGQPMDFSIQLGVRTRQIAPGSFEVIVSFGGHGKHGQKTAIIVELAYAGLFVLTGFPPHAIDPILHIEAPEMLFPFIRKIVNRLIFVNGMSESLDRVDFVELYNNERRR